MGAGGDTSQPSAGGSRASRQPAPELDVNPSSQLPAPTRVPSTAPKIWAEAYSPGAQSAGGEKDAWASLGFSNPGCRVSQALGSAGTPGRKGRQVLPASCPGVGPQTGPIPPARGIAQPALPRPGLPGPGRERELPAGGRGWGAVCSLASSAGSGLGLTRCFCKSVLDRAVMVTGIDCDFSFGIRSSQGTSQGWS